MRLASERQKERLRELDIEFDEDLEFEDATLILRDFLKPSTFVPVLNEHALIELSEPDGDS